MRPGGGFKFKFKFKYTLARSSLRNGYSLS
jgi:hypothetical protein